MAPGFSKLRVLAAGSVLLAGMLLAACGGEDRPNVEVIGGSGSGSGSVSGSASASGPLPAPAQGGGTINPNRYQTLANVDVYFAIALDLRDMKAALTPAQGSAPDYAAASAIFENGKNQVNASTGAVRAPAALLNDSVHAVFPNGPTVYGRPDFIAGIIRDALAGTGKAAGLSDDARREMVDKGMKMLLYGKALQEYTAAQTRIETGASNQTTPVDEAWAIIAGAPDNNLNRPYGLLKVANDREADFKLTGKLAAPMEQAFIASLAAAQKSDGAAFDKAFAEGTGYLNSIFYLSTLHYAKALESDSTPETREVHLAEGWTYWQTIRALAASGSSTAADTVESLLSRSAGQPWTSEDTSKVYAALNDQAVLAKLGIPPAVQVKTAP